MKITILAVLVLALVVVGCMGQSQSPPRTTGTDNDALGGRDTDDSNNDDTLDVPKQCKETVNFQVLVDALPRDAAGYAASSDPEGGTMSWADPQNPQNQVKYSTASVQLSNDDGSIDVSVMDTCYVSYLGAAWAGYFEYDGTNGYLKKTTVNGYPAWKQMDKGEENRYSYIVFLKDRILVSVSGSDGVPESAVAAAANGINYASIASAAN